MQTLGFVFTNYNNSEFTKSAISSMIFENGIFDYQIVIVDNDSDESNTQQLKFIKKERENNIHLILSKENIGYFRGLNLGIKQLKSTYPEMKYIIVGNNDLLFPDDFPAMIKNNKAVLDKYAVVSPDIVTANGIHQNPHVIKRISFVREIIYDIYYSNYLCTVLLSKIAKLTSHFTNRGDETQHNIAQEINQGHGSCYILSTLFFDNFDELWSPTFLMGEEAFLSIQLRNKNLTVYYEPNIKITHFYHAAIGKVSSKKMWEFSKKAHQEYRKYVKLWN